MTAGLNGGAASAASAASAISPMANTRARMMPRRLLLLDGACGDCSCASAAGLLAFFASLSPNSPAFSASSETASRKGLATKIASPASSATCSRWKRSSVSSLLCVLAERSRSHSAPCAAASVAPLMPACAPPPPVLPPPPRPPPPPPAGAVSPPLLPSPPLSQADHGNEGAHLGMRAQGTRGWLRARAPAPDAAARRWPWTSWRDLEVMTRALPVGSRCCARWVEGDADGEDEREVRRDRRRGRFGRDCGSDGGTRLSARMGQKRRRRRQQRRGRGRGHALQRTARRQPRRRRPRRPDPCSKRRRLSRRACRPVSWARVASCRARTSRPSSAGKSSEWLAEHARSDR